LQSYQSAPLPQRAKRVLFGVLVAVALGCFWAPPAPGQTTPDFSWEPPSPVAGEPITFTPSGIPSGATITWQYGPNYDPEGTFVPEETHSFAEAGSYSVTMRVEKHGEPPSDYTKTVTVRPVAAFGRDPPYSSVLMTGQQATFISDSVPWSGETITSLKWDVDGDGFDDGTGEVLTTSFATPGNQTVRLEVLQSNGERDVATAVFRVNAPPVASFIWAPGTPVAGSEVQLYSTSVDPEGPLASQAWDLDDDAQFDDASGSSATYSFNAGEHNVSLRVTDGDGVARTITRTITVATPPVTPPPPAATVTPAPPRMMNPFPTVRLSGLIVPRGVRNVLVEVRSAPRGARVTVRCTGRGCPFRSRRRIAETGRVRFSQFKRLLEAGARIQVFVRAPGVIGKYVGFRVRAGKRPLRADRCLMPGASEPTQCT
jgi:hypothetical protein